MSDTKSEIKEGAQLCLDFLSFKPVKIFDCLSTISCTGQKPICVFLSFDAPFTSNNY